MTLVESRPRLCKPIINPTVTATCKTIFCQAVSPRLRCLMTLMKSSRKPIRPLPKARNSTSMPAAICWGPSTSGAELWNTPYTTPMVSKMPKINPRPPMVGVPFFLLCQVGPSSRMVWPKCRRCKAGINSQQVIAVTAKPPTAPAAKIAETVGSMQSFLHIPQVKRRRGCTGLCVTPAAKQRKSPPGSHPVSWHGWLWPALHRRGGQTASSIVTLLRPFGNAQLQYHGF